MVSYLLSAGSGPLSAQSDREGDPGAPPAVWLQAGGGTAGVESLGGGPALVGQASYQRDAHRLTVRGVNLVQVPLGASGVDDEEDVFELGVLYGLARRGSLGWASLSAGAAWVSLPECGETELRPCDTVGVPMVAEAALRVYRGLGIGVQGFVDWNPERLFGGAALTLQLGRLP